MNCLCLNFIWILLKALEYIGLDSIVDEAEEIVDSSSETSDESDQEVEDDPEESPAVTTKNIMGNTVPSMEKDPINPDEIKSSDSIPISQVVEDSETEETSEEKRPPREPSLQRHI